MNCPGTVIFDLDGTLVDSIADIRAALNVMREHYSLPPLSLELVRRSIGNGARILVERVMTDAPGVDLTEALKFYNDKYHENLAVYTKLYPGTEDGLKQLSDAGFKLAVASNKPDALCRPLLRQLGVEQYFSVISGGNPAIPSKPAPDSLLAVLAETGSSPSSSWMCGDNYTDLKAGYAAGMKVVYCSYGFGDPQGETWDFEAKDFSGLTGEILSSL